MPANDDVNSPNLRMHAYPKILNGSMYEFPLQALQYSSQSDATSCRMPASIIRLHIRPPLSGLAYACRIIISPQVSHVT